MTNDIVTRLRNVPEKIIRMSGSEMNPYYNRSQEAADEIERLRAELADWQRTVRALEAELAEEQPERI